MLDPSRAAWMRDDTEAQYLVITTTPPTVHDHLSLSMTAHEVFKTLQGLFEKKTTFMTKVHNVQENNTTRVAACATNEVRNRLERTWESLPSNGTHREHERKTMDQGRVGRKRRVGEKGEKPRGRVEEGTGAASGPGMETTDQSADGVGLATLVSSPTAGRQVNDTTADTINPHATCTGPTRPVGKSSEPPRQELEPKSHDRTPPSKDASGSEVHELATGDKAKGGEMDDEDRRAHERVNDEDSRVEKSEDETTTTRPHAPQSMPLEGEWTGKASGGISKPTAPEMDPTRPSRDTEDATGDDERRPDTPAEPPNMPEGTRGRGSRDGDARVKTEVSRTSRGHAEATGEISDEPRRPTKPNDSPDELEVARVEEVETSLSKASRGVQEGPDDDDDEGRPGVPDEPSDEPSVESRGPADVQVEPGGETEAERNGCVVHEDTDAAVDGEVARAYQDAEVEVESAETHREASVEAEEWSASAHERSTATDEENDQRTSTNVNDVPEDPPDPPPPPDEAAKQHDEPPSVELEGEKGSRASCDDAPTRAETDALGAPKGDEDPRKRPKAAQNESDRVRERSERRDEENSPRRTQDEPDAPGDEAEASTASKGIEDGGTRPRKLRETSKQVSKRSEGSSQKNSPGRPGEEPEEPGGETAVPGDAYTYQEGPRGDASDDGGDANPPSRDRGPGGRLGERDELGDVEGDLERQSDGDGDGMEGRRGSKDGATSGARRDSKRVETRPLAEDETDQHGQRKRTTGDAPRPSTPPTIDPRRPTDHPNPPRRRGRLKTRPRRISTRRWTYQVTRTRRGRIGRIGCVKHVVHGL